MKPEKLQMSFDPHTIEHLGIKMYSVLPNAIAELIANAYDAEATEVHIKLYDNNSNRKIVVSDNGVGMSFDEVNDNFLRIGRKRREEDDGLSPNKKRKVTGRKGLGKLAFFGIGNIIEVKTIKDGESVSFIMSWDEIQNCNKTDYEPKFKKEHCEKEISGTEIVLSDLKRKTGFDKNALAVSLSKLFNFFDDNFKVYISLNDDKGILIDNKLKYENIMAQIKWIIPDTSNFNIEYLKEKNIVGEILATEKPLKPGLRGVTLFAHGRLVNSPEFFGVGESSHGYSYLTGWLSVDFIDEMEEDVISTDRQSLSWDLPIAEELRTNLQKLLHEIERDWRERRKAKKKVALSEKSGMNMDLWLSKVPPKIKTGVENIVGTLVDKSELNTEEQGKIVDTLHELLPEYTYYHYRHLHQKVQNASKSDYENKDYYRAFEEAIKKYIRDVQRKSGLQNTDVSLMNVSFGKDSNKRLKVAKKFKRKDGTNFNDSTIENVEEGQRWLSSGILMSARNPIAHEDVSELRDSGLFSEMDALDLLSLLSHLFRRLDSAELKKEEQENL